MMTKPAIEPDLIRQLAKILNDTDLTEIEVEQEGLKIRLARKAEAATNVTWTQGPQQYAAPAAPAATAAAPAPAAPADPAKNPNALRSVIVGTAYMASEPGARPFVQVGDVVRQGQTVVIVEAMKHMNQISSPRAGRVSAIFVTDGDPVEFDQPLMIIE